MYLSVEEYITLLTSLWQEVPQTKQQSLPIMILNKFHLITYNLRDSKHFNVIHCALCYLDSQMLLLLSSHVLFRVQKYFNILFVIVISPLIKFICKTIQVSEYYVPIEI